MVPEREEVPGRIQHVAPHVTPRKQNKCKLHSPAEYICLGIVFSEKPYEGRRMHLVPGCRHTAARRENWPEGAVRRCLVQVHNIGI